MLLRALIVDDSLPTRMELRSTLSNMGFQIMACGTKSVAWSMLNNEPVSLVVLNSQLPDGRGVDLLKMIRSNPKLSSVKTILLTNESDSDTRVLALSSGADRCIAKPFDREFLGRLAKDLCQGDTSQRYRYLLQEQKILVVDDSPTFASAAREYLRFGGNEVVLANSGEEALALIAAEPFACVFLDLSLPGIDGFTTCEKLRKLPHGRDALVLAVTGNEDPLVRQRALQAGCDDVAIKAPTIENLRVQMRSLLRRKRIEKERVEEPAKPAPVQTRVLAPVSRR